MEKNPRSFDRTRNDNYKPRFAISWPTRNRQRSKSTTRMTKRISIYSFNRSCNGFNYFFERNRFPFVISGQRRETICQISSSFSQFHKEQERVFVERLFYLVLNNVELTNFSTFNVFSIVSLSKELEKYQQSTKKAIGNSSKLNTIIQFVLSFSPSTISTFRLNNLFYLLLNDMNDFSGKIIDRIAELLRLYHFISYGQTISKQSLISSVRRVRDDCSLSTDRLLSQIDQAISTVNYANPLLYPFYENFLNASFIYKGPFVVPASTGNVRISLYTIIQNLAIALLGLSVDDFECEEQFLSFTSEQCYQIRLTLRRLTFLFLQCRYQIEYPLTHIDKQIVLYLIKLIVRQQKTAESLGRLLEMYISAVRTFAETKVKRLLYDLLIHGALEFYTLETIRYFLEWNRFNEEETCETISVLSDESPRFEDDLWLNDEQIRLVTHRFYSKSIYSDIFIPLINGDSREKPSIDDLLIYLDRLPSDDDEQVIDVQEMKKQLTIASWSLSATQECDDSRYPSVGSFSTLRWTMSDLNLDFYFPKRESEFRFSDVRKRQDVNHRREESPPHYASLDTRDALVFAKCVHQSHASEARATERERKNKDEKRATLGNSWYREEWCRWR